MVPNPYRELYQLIQQQYRFLRCRPQTSTYIDASITGNQVVLYPTTRPSKSTVWRRSVTLPYAIATLQAKLRERLQKETS